MKILFPIILLSFVLTSSCNTETVSYIPHEYIGNWFDTEGEDFWKLSFQHDFVIADNNFWYAEEIKRKENKLFLSLTNGSNRKDLHIEYLPDSTIKIGNKVFTKNFSNIKRKPQNQQISLKGGEATIMGYVNNFQQSYDSVDRVQFLAHDFLLNEQKSYFAIIDSVSGRFELSINLNSPQDIYFQYGAKPSLSTLFLHPDDTLLMYIDAGLANSKQEIHFMGKYADVCYDLNQMYSPYMAYMPSYEEKRKALGKVPEEYYQYRTDLKEKHLRFLEQYCSTNECSETFKLWFRKNAEAQYYRDLMALSYRGAYRLIGKLKKDYESLFIEDIDLNDSLYRISSSYPFLLSRLSQSMIDFSDRSNQHKKEFEKIKKLFISKEYELSQEEIAFVHSIDAYQLEKEIPEVKQKQWWNLINRFDKEVKILEAQAPIDWLLEEIEKIEDDKLK